MRSAFPRVAVLAALLPAALTGCGKSSSPESVFAEFKDANEKKDAKRVVACYSEDHQTTLAASFVLVGKLTKTAGGGDIRKPSEAMETAKKVAAVLANHGVTDDYLMGLEKKNYGSDFTGMFNDMAAPVKNKPAFIAEMMAALPAENGKVFFTEPKAMKDLKIEGTTATAKVVVVKNGKDVEEPLDFESKNGVWKIKPNIAGLKGGGPFKR